MLHENIDALKMGEIHYIPRVTVLEAIQGPKDHCVVYSYSPDAARNMYTMGSTVNCIVMHHMLSLFN